MSTTVPDFTYWSAVSDHASASAYFVDPEHPRELLSIETNPDLARLSMGSFVRENTRSFLELLRILEPETKDLLLSYYFVGKTQEWIGNRLAKRPQYLISAEIIRANRLLSAQTVIGTNPSIQQMRSILVQANLETQYLRIRAKKPETRKLSLAHLIHLYRRNKNFSQTATSVGVHCPTVLRTFRHAVKRLQASDNLAQLSLGSYIRQLYRTPRKQSTHLTITDSPLLGQFEVDATHPDLQQLFQTSADQDQQ